jgi:structural maintenance of chromosome 4
MKPKAQGPHDEGFLEYLEDIIGTNKYVEKIDELNKQLETLNESRSGVVQMVKLAEKERDNLEGLKDEAETYMLKELSHLKWQEKATKMAYEDTVAKITEQRDSLQNLENSLKDERVKMDESNEELKKFESVHEKHKKRQEVLDNELRACKEKFKEFERQDVKHREDLKHVKQKIKKLEDKLEKDSSKIGDMTKESEDSSNLIPKLQENIPKLQKVLLDEEKKLEEIKAIAKVETEGYRSELTKIRAELEPWEKDLIVHRGKLDVASSESELLSKKHEAALKAFTDAQKQLSDISTRKKRKSCSNYLLES